MTYNIIKLANTHALLIYFTCMSGCSLFMSKGVVSNSCGLDGTGSSACNSLPKNGKSSICPVSKSVFH